MKSKITDFLIVIFSVLIFLPLLIFTGFIANDKISLIIMTLIFIPTGMALVNGAPFVPTPMKRVRKMLETAGVKKGNTVYDIGCGDGRMVYLAANEFGANATGYELSPLVYLLAIIRKFFWRSKAKIIFGNFKKKNLKNADFIFCYLLPDTLKSLENKFKTELNPGTKIVSYAFEIPYLKLIFKEERTKSENFAPIWIYEV